jgi:hypothetical protein
MKNTQLNDLFKDLATSPCMYPEEIDFEERVVHFCRMNRDTYAQSAFLDSRKARVDKNNYKVKLDYVLNNFGVSKQPPAAINWLFHTPHSGSTLLARALDAMDGGFVLQEPILLIQASSLKRHSKYDQWKQSGDWCRFITMVQELLSRTFSATDVALIKTTSVCHNLVHDIFDGTRQARGIFLYSGLEKYLVSLYKGGYLDSYLTAGFQGASHDMLKLDLIGQGEMEKLPKNRKVALLWLSIVLNMSVYMEDNPGKRILALDCRQLFSDREETLLMLADHFGYSSEPSSIEAIVNGPVFNRNAKRQGEKWSEADVSGQNKMVRRKYDTEIADALSWAESLMQGGNLEVSI